MPPAGRAHPWSFPRSIRPNAFGWRSSKLAASRLREALTEIRAVARFDPVLAADGAVCLLERIAPAFEEIDTSTGALGTATNKVVKSLLELLRVARPTAGFRDEWVRRLELAIAADGFDWLFELHGRLGEIAGGDANAVPSSPVAPGLSVSQTFLEFLEPEWQVLHGSPEVWAGLLQNGQLVWNAVVMADHGGNSRGLDAIRQQIAGHAAGAMIEALVARKRAHFDEHRWLVRDCSIFERDGVFRLHVEAGRLP